MRAVLLAALCLAPTLVTAGSTSRLEHTAPVNVIVPRVTWAEFAPHVRSRVVPLMRDGHFEVMVCTSAVERGATANYDEKLGELAMIILLDIMENDPAGRAEMERLVAPWRLRESRLRAEEREFWMPLFWRDLDSKQRLMRMVRERYERARGLGWMRCRACEHPGAGIPVHLEVAGDRPMTCPS